MARSILLIKINSRAFVNEFRSLRGGKRLTRTVICTRTVHTYLALGGDESYFFSRFLARVHCRFSRQYFREEERFFWSRDKERMLRDATGIDRSRRIISGRTDEPQTAPATSHARDVSAEVHSRYRSLQRRYGLLTRGTDPPTYRGAVKSAHDHVVRSRGLAFAISSITVSDLGLVWTKRVSRSIPNPDR